MLRVYDSVCTSRAALICCATREYLRSIDCPSLDCGRANEAWSATGVDARAGERVRSVASAVGIQLQYYMDRTTGKLLDCCLKIDLQRAGM